MSNLISRSKKTPKILRLKGVSFEGRGNIDYTDELIQELYILRYSYSYSFEYDVMYSKILDLFEGADYQKNKDEETEKPKYQSIFSASNREFKFPDGLSDYLTNLTDNAAIDEKDKTKEKNANASKASISAHIIPV